MIEDFSHLTGCLVRVPAGAEVHTTGKAGTRTSTRAQVVRIDHVIGGYDTPGYTPRKAQARWAGSGGYWREVNADLVELIEER